MLSASWALFRDRGLSQTPLELPMTKAAVKAMDVIGNAVKQRKDLPMTENTRTHGANQDCITPGEHLETK